MSDEKENVPIKDPSSIINIDGGGRPEGPSLEIRNAPNDIIFMNNTNSEFCRITKEGKFVLNRERFPDATPDDFAKAFIAIVERWVFRHIDMCPRCGWKKP